jgi:hypothetical protein
MGGELRSGREAMMLDPPLAEYDRLRSVYIQNARSQGIDLFIGRRTHRLFRGAGLIDISVDVAIQAHPPGHSRRPIFRDFLLNVREKLIAGGFITKRISSMTSALTRASLPILRSLRPPSSIFACAGVFRRSTPLDTIPQAARAADLARAFAHLAGALDDLPVMRG